MSRPAVSEASVALLGDADDSWRDLAACQGLDVTLFFPAVSPHGPRTAVPADDHAKAVCATCPVARACLDWAIHTRQEDGIWGGTTPQERRAIRRRRRRQGTPAADGNHGTLAGWDLHRQAGEAACQECRDAHDEDVARRRAERKARRAGDPNNKQNRYMRRLRERVAAGDPTLRHGTRPVSRAGCKCTPCREAR